MKRRLAGLVRVDSTCREACRKVSNSWPTASVPRPHAQQDDLHGVHHPAADPKLYKYSAEQIGADLKAQRSANLITLRDAHGSDFVTVTWQILMAVHTHGSREANIMKCQAMAPQPPK